MKRNNTLIQVLSPFGNWAHAKGNQVVDGLAADRMKSASEGFFPREIPIYVGHPDEKSARCKDKRVGVVRKIFKAEDGILVEAQYDDATFEKIKSGEIRCMSPRWEMDKIGDGEFRPVRLVSVGLTNNPNIAGSGRIIRAALPKIGARLAESGVKISGAAREFGMLGRRLAASAKHLDEISGEIAKRRLEKNLEIFAGTPGANSETEGCNSRTDTNFKAVSDEAVKLSLSTGEPYTKTFAKLRKQKTINNQ